MVVVNSFKFAWKLEASSRVHPAICSSRCNNIQPAANLQEMENLKKAEDLLKKLGFKGSLFVAPKEEDHEESSTVEEDEKESRAA